MKGDFTRNTFKPEDDFTGVRMQQGRVLLDADWNEQQDIVAYLRRQSLRDLIGLAGGPVDTAGFKIISPDGIHLRITRGRYYLEGIQLDNEADDQDALDLDKQPYLPGFDPAGGLIEGSYLIYLKAWERHITAVENSRLLEVALGGADTTTRTQVVWQVKLERLGPIVPNLDCGKIDQTWHPSCDEVTGKLSARTGPVAVPDDDCLLPTKGGYRGLENRLYRIEIHKGGDEQHANFKWSRENGSVVTTWNGTNGNNISIGSTGKDNVLKFVAGGWVELSSDEQELSSQLGTLAQIKGVNEDTLTVNTNHVDGSLDPNQFSGIHTARRWEGFAPVKDFMIWNELEAGIQIKLTAGNYCTGDYWLIPARAHIGSEGGEIEWPNTGSEALAQLPTGVVRAYGVLALGNYDGNRWNTLTDCRRLFPRLTAIASGSNYGSSGKNSCCPITVGDGVLSHGNFDDLQGAVDYARSLKQPIRICLLTGKHKISKPIAVWGSESAPITLTGCGPSSILNFSPRDMRTQLKIIRVNPSQSIALNIEHPSPSRIYELLVRAEGQSGSAWLHAGQVNTGSGGQLPLVMSLPQSVANIKRLRLQLQDTVDSKVVAESTFDNFISPGAVTWHTMEQPASDAMSLLLVGNFVHLQDLVIGSSESGAPTAVLTGQAIQVRDCVFESANAEALIVWDGHEISITNSQFSGHRLSVVLHGDGVEFLKNQLTGGINVVAGSANINLIGNRIRVMLSGDDFTEYRSGVLLGSLLAQNLVDSLTKLHDWVIESGGEITSFNRGTGSISSVMLKENQVRGSTIGVATSNEISISQTEVRNLSIFRNDIRECGQRVPGGIPPPIGGGLSLESVNGLEIRNNTILNNGTPNGGWGILLAHCQGVKISCNQIVANGGVQSGQTAEYFQAGIIAVDVRKQRDSPAVILQDNTVISPAGPALVLVGLGDLTITNNWLTSLGIVRQTLTLPYGMTPMIKSALSKSGAPGMCVNIVQLGGLSSGDNHSTLFARALFNANQVSLTITNEVLESKSPVVTLFSLGQLLVQGNQFLFNRSMDDKSQQDVHTRIEGILLSVSGNMFVETPDRVAFSCITSGYMINSTTDNQAVHGIQVLTSDRKAQTVDHDNKILVPRKATVEPHVSIPVVIPSLQYLT